MQFLLRMLQTITVQMPDGLHTVEQPYLLEELLILLGIAWTGPAALSQVTVAPRGCYVAMYGSSGSNL
jgi:hypothetical protein